MTQPASKRLLTEARLGGSGYVAKPNGDGRAGVVDWANDDSAGYLFHLHTGPNSSGGAAIGIGLDAGSANGMLISAKAYGTGLLVTNNPSSTGYGAQIQSWSAGAPGLRVDQFAGAAPIQFVQKASAGFADGATTVGSTTFRSNAAAFTSADVGQVLAQLTSTTGYGIADGTTIASVTNATTVVMSKAAVATVTGINFEVRGRQHTPWLPFMTWSRTDGSTLGAISASSVSWYTNHEIIGAGDNAAEIFTTPDGMRLYQYNAPGGNYFGHYIQGSGETLRIQSYAAAQRGTESVAFDAMKIQYQKVGFFGANPVTRPTLAAAATDAATTQALVNSIRTALVNLGLGA